MSAIKIDKNIPIPDFSAMKKPRGVTSKYPFDQMTAVGDSFAVPYTTWTTAKGAETNTFERVRATVGQRNRRDRSREFQSAVMEENGERVVRVWLLRDDKIAAAKG